MWSDVDVDDRHDDVVFGLTHTHAMQSAIIMIISVKGLQCTSSGENRSACVVSICVTLDRKEKTCDSHQEEIYRS